MHRDGRQVQSPQEWQGFTCRLAGSSCKLRSADSSKVAWEIGRAQLAMASAAHATPVGPRLASQEMLGMAPVLPLVIWVRISMRPVW